MSLFNFHLQLRVNFYLNFNFSLQKNFFHQLLRRHATPCQLSDTDIHGLGYGNDVKSLLMGYGDIAGNPLEVWTVRW